jgi:hypothetical protein
MPGKSRRDLYIVEIEVRKRLVQELYGIEPVVFDLNRFVQRKAQMILLAGLELRRRFRREGFLLDRRGIWGPVGWLSQNVLGDRMVIYRTRAGRRGDG